MVRETTDNTIDMIVKIREIENPSVCASKLPVTPLPPSPALREKRGHDVTTPNPRDGGCTNIPITR